MKAASHPPRRRWRMRLKAWREAHLYSLFSSIGRLMQRPWATLLTAGVMALALALPLCLAMLIGNVERFSGNFRASSDISLFLLPGMQAEAAQALAQRLQGEADVAAVLLRSPEQGLAEFRELADFSEALTLLDENPLPAVLVLTPAAGRDPLALAQRFQSWPEVDFVQHDALWRARLEAWLALGRHLTLLAAGLLGIGALLVVGNTVRLDIQGRAEEIRTVQLLGATDGFVRRPFLYLGTWYGVLAGVLALLVAMLVPRLLQTPVAALAESYGSGFRLHGLAPEWMALAQAVSMLLGWLGAWLATSHHLRRSAAEVESKT